MFKLLYPGQECKKQTLQCWQNGSSRPGEADSPLKRCIIMCAAYYVSFWAEELQFWLVTGKNGTLTILYHWWLEFILQTGFWLCTFHTLAHLFGGEHHSTCSCDKRDQWSRAVDWWKGYSGRTFLHHDSRQWLNHTCKWWKPHKHVSLNLK